jgi:hypothetical protein
MLNTVNPAGKYRLSTKSDTVATQRSLIEVPCWKDVLSITIGPDQRPHIGNSSSIESAKRPLQLIFGISECVGLRSVYMLARSDVFPHDGTWRSGRWAYLEAPSLCAARRLVYHNQTHSQGQASETDIRSARTDTRGVDRGLSHTIHAASFSSTDHRL